MQNGSLIDLEPRKAYVMANSRHSPKDLKASLRVQAFIKSWERLRLTRYFDQGGKPTIGWGHLLDHELFDVIDLKKAEALFRDDLQHAAETVRRLVKVDLWQSEFDALVSLVWNIGREPFRKSTMLKLLNKADYRGASDEFIRWRFVDGVESKGLLRRRQAERQFFNTVPF